MRPVTGAPIVIGLKNLPPGEYEVDDTGTLVRVDKVVLPELEKAEAKLSHLFERMMDEGLKDDTVLWPEIQRVQDEIAELEVYQEALEEVRDAEDAE